MQVLPEFFAAKKDKNVSSLIIKREKTNGEMRDFMYLCIDTPIKYTEKTELVFVETNINLRVNNYSKLGTINLRKSDVSLICFHLSVYNENFVTNFLKSIKKDSIVSFKVVAYNGCDAWDEVGYVSHQLYGSIDGREYFLSSYVGKDNTASPVQ
jgi:hypothetical protein